MFGASTLSSFQECFYSCVCRSAVSWKVNIFCQRAQFCGHSANCWLSVCLCMCCDEYDWAQTWFPIEKILVNRNSSFQLEGTCIFMRISLTTEKSATFCGSFKWPNLARKLSTAISHWSLSDILTFYNDRSVPPLPVFLHCFSPIPPSQLGQTFP